MAVRIVRLGTERANGEGLRIGTVRHPPRGVTKEEFASRNFYTDFSVGCYCADEARCHRSVLRDLLAERGAALA